MTDPQDYILRQAGRAAQRYQVDDEQVARCYQRLAAATAARTWTYAAGLRTGSLTASLLEVAETHKAQCTAASCATCDSIASSVAMMLAFARFDVDAELRQLL